MSERDYDYVAQLPDPIVDYQKSGRKDKEIQVDKGVVAAIQGERYFIHCVATLPVQDFKSDLGFGLWVEVNRDDFFRYIKSQENDEDYLGFSCEGTLANPWPLFPSTYGNLVKIKVIDKEQKPFIVDVGSSDVELSKYEKVGSLDSRQKEILRKRVKRFYLPPGKGPNLP